MGSLDCLRVYGPDELGKDGYSAAWHAEVKHLVRELAGNRCVRCGHPYAKGAGEWSICDRKCRHGGPGRLGDDPSGIGALRYRVVDDLPERELPDTLREARWRILTVHHLDGDKANCRWWNLAALCQRCHLTIQGRVKMDRVWSWEHSEWFKPYVAGFYAWSYLGEDLTREQVDGRLDELLALECAVQR